MSEAIGQRELRNDSGVVMRRVENGESFTITRNGRPVADLVPHSRPADEHRLTLGEVQNAFRALPPVDAQRWAADQEAAREYLRDDDTDSR